MSHREDKTLPPDTRLAFAESRCEQAMYDATGAKNAARSARLIALVAIAIAIGSLFLRWHF